jgi:hypothetical protein
MVQGMKNNFNYNCPVSWADLPQECNWVIINGSSNRYVIEAFQTMPYPDVKDGKVWWESFDSNNSLYGKSIDGDECATLEFTVSGDQYPLDTSFCIWQRPINIQITYSPIQNISEELNKVVKVQALQDQSGHWYVIPDELADDFYNLDGSENDEDINIFTERYWKYVTGGDLNLVQLYADISAVSDPKKAN